MGRRRLAARPRREPVTDAWLALLAAGPAAEEDREPDDDYPVEWLDEDWLAAPDRVDFLEEIAPPLVPRPNTAAGGAEHLAALERNALFDAFVAARRAAAFEGAARGQNTHRPVRQSGHASAGGGPGSVRRGT